MKTIEIGMSGVQASQAALGVMRMDGVAADTAAQVVRTAIDHGVNFFDTADIYGFSKHCMHGSSMAFGKALKAAGVRREDVIIQTKFGIDIEYRSDGSVRGRGYDFSKNHLITMLDEELRALGTDHVDFALLHRPDSLFEPEEVAEAFDELQKAGKVLHFGVSNMGPWQVELLQSALRQHLEANQLQFGLGHARIVSDEVLVNSMQQGVTADNHSDGMLSYSRLRRITIQAWSPFHSEQGGTYVGDAQFPELNAELNRLADKYGVTPNGIALAWISRHPANIQTLIGSMNPSRLEDILTGADVTLEREDWWSLYAAAGNPIL